MIKLPLATEGGWFLIVVVVVCERNLRMPERLETYLLSESAMAKDWPRPKEAEE